LFTYTFSVKATFHLERSYPLIAWNYISIDLKLIANIKKPLRRYIGKVLAVHFIVMPSLRTKTSMVALCWGTVVLWARFLSWCQQWQWA